MPILIGFGIAIFVVIVFGTSAFAGVIVVKFWQRFCNRGSI